MNQICWLSFLLFHSFVLLISANPTKSPLIFNPHTLEIYNPDDKPSIIQEKNAYSVACPSMSKKEKSVNKNISLDKKALFVQNIADDPDYDLFHIQCEESIKLSLVFHSVDDEKKLEFGYEVFYKESQMEDDYKQSNFKEFGKVDEMNSLVKPVFRSLSGRSNSIKDQDIKWIFAWIPKIKLQYDTNKKIVTSVSYVVEHRKYQRERDCKDDNLSNHWFDVNLDKLYSQDNQAEIFSPVSLPSYADNICKVKYQCLISYNLVSANYYQTSASEPVSCSNLTQIPIWYLETDALLNFSETFLTVLAQVVGKGLEVTVGVHDVLSLEPISTKKDSKPIPIYLDHEKRKVPVPKIIYKIISYKPPGCKITYDNSCKYDILIIIHNHPELRNSDLLCLDICENWGWGTIRYLNTAKNKITDFMYCCELTESMKRLLRYDERTLSNGALNLKEFPVYPEEGKGPRLEYMVNDVEKRISLYFDDKMYNK